MSRRKPHPKLSNSFGKAVRQLREGANFSQEAFAHHCDLDRAAYGRIERGLLTPNVATLWKIAEGLGKRPQEVIAAVEKDMKAEKEPEAEKGVWETSASPAAKKNGKRLGYAGKSGKVGKPDKGGGKD